LSNPSVIQISHSRNLSETLRDFWLSIRRQETVEYFLLFGLFLSCTTAYQIPIGSHSVSPAEIFAWLFILWRWTVGGRNATQLGRGIRRLIWGFRAFAIYTGILWLLSNDWSFRGGMFTTWVLAALLVDCLLRSRWIDWKPVAALFILAALPNAVWGTLQHAMGIGLAPKDLSGWGTNAASFPIFGFFGHSNDLAVYMYWPLLVCVGLISSFRSWRRAGVVLLALLYALVLYWTISRTTLLAVGLVAVVVALAILVHRRRIFLLAVSAGAVLTALGIAWIFLTQPLEWINSTLSGRLSLWNEGLQTIFSDKYLLVFGYLAVLPANLKIWWLPHNIYTLFWIEFGLLGFLFLIGLGSYCMYSGWKRYEKLRTRFHAVVPWAGMAGLFLIIGMAGLYFHETYVIVNFLCVFAIWMTQIQEIDSPLSAGNSTHPQTEKGSAAV
jgi:hypothetical protein